MGSISDPQQFPAALDSVSKLSGAGVAYFGRDVLTGLVDGIAAALIEPTSRRVLGPAVLGSAMWMDDPALLDVLTETANACIVIDKQARRIHRKPRWTRVREFSEAQGLMAYAFPELEDLAPTMDGGSRVVGPYDPRWSYQMEIGGVREVGFRGEGGPLLPIMHAKIALLGHIIWTDEHPSGAVVDEVLLRPASAVDRVRKFHSEF